MTAEVAVEPENCCQERVERPVGQMWEMLENREAMALETDGHWLVWLEVSDDEASSL
jgi:hypothetical protein